MKLTDKLLAITQSVNGNGGINFLKIRFFLEDVDRLLAEGNPRAEEFARCLDVVQKAIAHATTMKFDT